MSHEPDDYLRVYFFCLSIKVQCVLFIYITNSKTVVFLLTDKLFTSKGESDYA